MVTQSSSARRIHHHLVEALRRSGHLDGALDLHRAPSGSSDSHSASAWSTARSKRRGRMPYMRGGLVRIARQDVGLEALHQRAHQLERLAGHGGHHGARRRGEGGRQPQRHAPHADRRPRSPRPAPRRSARRGRRCRASARPRPAPRGCARGTRSRRARRSAGCGSRASAAGAARGGARPAARAAGTRTSPAPITIDARSAVEPAPRRAGCSSTSSREPRCARGARPAGAMPPRYTMRSTPAAAAASANVVGRAPVARREVAAAVRGAASIECTR